MGRVLRVAATYTDGNVTDVDGDDGDDGDMVRFMTMYAVQAAGGGSENQSPDFEDGSVERTVGEHIAVGANVGAPGHGVCGTVPVSSKDRLTYGLRAVTEADITAINGAGVNHPVSVDGTATAAAAEADLDHFEIDQATGQITVVQGLNFESRPEEDSVYPRREVRRGRRGHGSQCGSRSRSHRRV